MSTLFKFRFICFAYLSYSGVGFAIRRSNSWTSQKHTLGSKFIVCVTVQSGTSFAVLWATHVSLYNERVRLIRDYRLGAKPVRANDRFLIANFGGESIGAAVNITRSQSARDRVDVRLRNFVRIPLAAASTSFARSLALSLSRLQTVRSKLYSGLSFRFRKRGVSNFPPWKNKICFPSVFSIESIQRRVVHFPRDFSECIVTHL